MRERLMVVLAAVATLTGCVGDPTPGPVMDTRMPLTVDYRAHRTVHPPVKRPEGKVDPVDPRPDRVRDFGPESRLLPSPGPSKLLAELAAFRAREPVHADTLLALARKKKVPTRTAKFDEDGPAADDPPPVRQSRGREAKLDPDAVKDEGSGYRLNFEDAEVKDVLQAVLGNVLGMSYTIAPNVSGRITISSTAPQDKAELIATLESVLAMQGLSMTKNGSTYRIAPATVGGGTVDEDGKGAGFGISVVPLEFTSVASMTKLLNGFVTDQDGIRIDPSRNAVIVRGPGPRREEIVRAIKSFDGDWMHAQSVSVVELRRSKPDEVIGELNRIFDSEAATGNAAGVIQFKAVKRLRAIMVISRAPALIRRATNWIRRLDHQDNSATDSIFVYRPRYRDARELTRLVNNLFGNSQGSQGNEQSGGVSFQNGQQGQGGASGQAGTIGMSSASFAGGLSSGSSSGGLGSGGGLGGSSGGLGSTGGGLGGSSGGLGAGNSSFGSGAAGGPGSGGGAGGGLQGNLADPVEAGQGQGGNGKAHLALSADVSNNSIVAYTDGETYAKVQSVLRQLDVPTLQVAINVVIAEVQLNDELKYGIQFYLRSHNLAGISLAQTAQSAATSALASSVPGLNFILGGQATPDVIISALDSISKVHVLSTPSIVVSENKPATFEVGNQVPVVTQQATSSLIGISPTLNQVQYLDTGIILKIIPRIGQKGDVAMDLDQVISNVVPDASGSTSDSLTPTISKRRVASAISVKSGQSVLLAGLINDTRQQAKGQVPFIGQQLGDIFGNRDNQFIRSELVVFIRPVIIRDGLDAQSVAEDFRGQLKAMDLSGGPAYKK